jgi:alpha-glucoside transport system permease protein
MVDLFHALLTVGLGIGIFIGGLLILYQGTNLLPAKWRSRGQVSVFLGPALVALVVGLAIPALGTVFASMYRDPQLPAGTNGFLSNYRFLFSDSLERRAILNSALWVIGGGTVSTVFGLTIARYANGMKRESIVKSLIFIPVSLSLAGAGIIWKFVYDGPPFDYGLLNAVTKAIPGWPNGAGGDGKRLWLVENGFSMNTLLLIVILIWVQTGFAVVVLSAAIKGVPTSIEEAARVDGATDSQIFFRISLPCIRGALLTVITTGTIASLKAFDIVQATTGGNFKTTTIANEYYTNYYTQNRERVAAALAVLMFLIVAPVVVLNQRGQKRAAELSAT